MAWQKQYSINEDIAGKVLLEHQLKQEMATALPNLTFIDVHRLGDAFWVDVTTKPIGVDQNTISSTVQNHVPVVEDE